MKFRFRRTLILLCSLISSYSLLYGQLEVDTLHTGTTLAEYLSGPGVTVSNAVLTCAPGGSGIFTQGGSTNLGIGSGVVLTSGDAYGLDIAGDTVGVQGPNDSGSFTGTTPAPPGGGNYDPWPGDPDLDALIPGFTTNDACILEFEVTSTCADTIKFNYVFGSEEYLEWVNSVFNDVFGLFVSGPGIVGLENIAVVPAGGGVVSIDNLNDVVNSAYYVDNGDGFTPPQNTDPSYIQYDGFTVVMEAVFAVIPGSTYQLKLAIADAGDSALDSGIFIEAGSLTANVVQVSSTTDIAGFPDVVEGCVNGILNLFVDAPLLDTLVVGLEYSGTAVNGVDYTDALTGGLLPDSIVLLPGDTSESILFIATEDFITEGTETLVINILNSCFVAADSVVINLTDEIEIGVSFVDTTICAGDPIDLEVFGAINYLWEPNNTSINDPTSATPSVSPLNSTVYTVTGVVGPCLDTEQVTVNVSGGSIADAGPDLQICFGESIELPGNNSSNAISYDWSPVTDLSDPTIPNPVASPMVTTEYILLTEDIEGCQDIDTILLEVLPQVTADAGADQLICVGQIASLNASGGVTYEWTPSAGLSCDDCPNPAASPDNTTMYSVTAYVSSTCFATDDVLVEVSGTLADAGSDLSFCTEGTETIGPSAVDISLDYTWTDEAGGFISNDPNPTITVASPDGTPQEYFYTLTIEDSQGCINTDEMSINILGSPIMNAGENDTIIEGNSAMLAGSGAGSSGTYLWTPNDVVLNPSSSVSASFPTETTTFTLVGANAQGCESSDEVTVVVLPRPSALVATAFSPNGDGQNDELIINHYQIEELIGFYIYSRWGELIYVNESDIEEGWDGTYFGKEAEIGAYAYVLVVKPLGIDDIWTSKGNVTLIR